MTEHWEASPPTPHGGPDSRIDHRPAPTEYWFEEGCFILEWLNTDDEPEVSVARARVPPHTATKWHRLHGIRERYVILSGSGVVEVAGLQPTPVTAGAVVNIAPGEAQHIRNAGDDDLEFLVVCTPRFIPARYEAVREDVAGHIQ